MKKQIYKLLSALLITASPLAAEEAAEPLYDTPVLVENAAEEPLNQANEEEAALAEFAEQGITENMYLEAAAQFEVDPRAYLWAMNIGFEGSSIELMDGSVWEVRWYDRYKVQNWKNVATNNGSEQSDRLYIQPNSSWSTYPYTIVNMETGETAAVYMTQFPYFDSPYVRCLKFIDKKNGRILLNDGTYWNVSSFSNATLHNWEINNSIVIGVNKGLSSYFNPYILINLSRKTYISVSTLN